MAVFLNEPAHRGAAAVVLTGDRRKVLLQKREDFRIWTLPGGFVEPGERDEDAAVREVREETGYEVTLVRMTGRYERPDVRRGARLVTCYEARVVGGMLVSRGPETRGVAWFPVDHLPWSLPRLSREVVQDALTAAEPVYRVQRVSPILALLIDILLALRDLRNRLFGRHH